MLKRTMAIVLVIALTSTPTSALAQSCYVGLYADDQGTIGTMCPGLDPNNPLLPVIKDIYAVAFAEDVMNAMAYKLVNPDPATAIVLGGSYGPSGLGIALTTEDGEFIGLGECAIGFGGGAIVIAHYEVLFTPDFPLGEFCLVPNTGQGSLTDPTKAQYSTCQDVLKPCDIGPCLLVECGFATESMSFGAVKALY